MDLVTFAVGQEIAGSIHDYFSHRVVGQEINANDKPFEYRELERSKIQHVRAEEKPLSDKMKPIEEAIFLSVCFQRFRLGCDTNVRREQLRSQVVR